MSLQPAVDLSDRVVEPLVDRLVVLLAADVGAVELLAVEQRHHGVARTPCSAPARRERHVADGQHVLAVGRELRARPLMPPRVPNGMPSLYGCWLPAPGEALRRSEMIMFGDVAIRGRRSAPPSDRRPPAARSSARPRPHWSRKRRRHLQRFGVVVEAVLQRILRQPGGRIDRRARAGRAPRSRIRGGSGGAAAREPAYGSRSCAWSSASRASSPCLCTVAASALLRCRRRRHQAAAQFPDRGFPDLRILRHVIGGHRVERDAAGPVGRVVALDAIRLDRLRHARRAARRAAIRRTPRCSPPRTGRRKGQHARHGSTSLGDPRGEPLVQGSSGLIIPLKSTEIP